MQKQNKQLLILVSIILIITILATQLYFIIQNNNKILELQTKQQSFGNEIIDVRRENQQRFEEFSDVLIESGLQISKLEQQVANVQVSSQDFSGIIEKALPAVVSIRTDIGQGSGAIVSPSGYIITNTHVIAGASKIQVLTYDNKIYNTKLIGYDTKTDIAVLKIEGQFKRLRFGDSDDTIVGERVIALGNPFGLSFSVTEGIVSATHRKASNDYYYTQTDVPINPGNSGGPLLDIEGKIIGINNFKIKDAEGIGFAIESNSASKKYSQIVNEYELMLE